MQKVHFALEHAMLTPVHYAWHLKLNVERPGRTELSSWRELVAINCVGFGLGLQQSGILLDFRILNFQFIPWQTSNLQPNARAKVSLAAHAMPASSQRSNRDKRRFAQRSRQGNSMRRNPSLPTFRRRWTERRSAKLFIRIAPTDERVRSTVLSGPPKSGSGR
jgi:hypothetical protein